MLTRATCENACGKLPSWRPGRRVVLLGQQADVVAQRQQPLEQRRAPRRAGPCSAQVVGQPEGAGQERALARRQAVDAAPRRRRSASTKPSRISSRSIAATVPAHPRVVGGQEADQRDHAAGWRRARVDAVGLREGVALGVEALARRPRRGSRRAAPASGRPGRRSPNRSTALTARSSGHPGHHLGVGEVPPRAADLPDALVGLAPRRLEELEQRLLQVPGRPRRSPGRRARAWCSASMTSP